MQIVQRNTTSEKWIQSSMGSFISAVLADIRSQKKGQNCFWYCINVFKMFLAHVLVLRGPFAAGPCRYEGHNQAAAYINTESDEVPSSPDFPLEIQD